MIGKGLARLNQTFIKEEDRFQTIEIEDIPIMYGEDGSIVCIPKESEVSAIAIVGNSGSGKSLILNRLHSHMYWHWNDNVAIMNDISEETYKWSELMFTYDFNEFNKRYLNQETCPSPMVYLYPNTNTLKIDEEMLKNKNYLKIVVPFSEIMDNLGNIISGINPEFDIGKSAMYINNLKDQLNECDTASQVKEVLNENLPGQDGKTFGAMRVKIMNAFDSLFNEEILDITNPECHAHLKVEIDGEMFMSNPFSVLMKARLIPSFITSDLSIKKYKSEIMAFYVNAIFQNNKEDFPNNRTWLFFDELKDVCISDLEPAAKAIGLVAARGRMNNVGLVYATQYYNQIPKSVKGAKLNYCLAFGHSNNDILTEIASDFDLNPETKKKIKNLKKYECIAMTKNKFICYRDDEKWEVSTPIKGRIFFPIAGHRKAGGEKKK